MVAVRAELVMSFNSKIFLSIVLLCSMQTAYSLKVPGPPSGVFGSARDASVVVSWVAPSNNGGAPITMYTVTSVPGNKICFTSGKKICTVMGLTNGRSYKFTVKATNKIG